jgi:predicted double-glycine peptidase
LQLEDLHQEFQRDISGLNNLEDTKIASMISLEELNVYLASQTEEFKESFYSIMSNITENNFQAQVLEFNKNY